MNALLDWLIETTWQASILIALVAVVQALFGRWIPARWRYALWLLVVLRLLLPSLSLPMQPATVYRYVPERPQQAWRMAAEAMAPPVEKTPARTPVPTAGAAGLETMPPSFDFEMLAFTIWLGGVLGILAIQTGRQFAFHRRLRREKRISMPELDRMLERCRQILRIRQSIRLVVTNTVFTPAIVGLWTPRLLLPAPLARSLAANRMQMVFLHELTHVRRLDLPASLIAGLAQCLHWFNPLVWWAITRMNADREMAVDAVVLATRHNNREYGETLLDLVERASTAVFPSPALGILENKRDFRTRILAIANFRRSTWAWSLVGIGLVVAIAILTFGRKPPSIAPVRHANSQEIETMELAIWKGELEEIRYPVEHGAEVPPGALTLAAENALYDLTKLFLDHGANPNEQDESGRTPLQATAHTYAGAGIYYRKLPESDFLHVAKLLVARGADVNLRDDNGRNAAWNAASFANAPQILEFLIKKGIRLDGYDKRGNTLLYYTTQGGSPAVFDDEVTGERINETEIQAAYERERRIVDLLAAAGVDLNQRPAPGTDGSDDTPLIKAIAGGHFGIARGLLDHGADIHARDKYGNSALSFAFMGFAGQPPQLDIIRSLLAHGGDANATHINPNRRPPGPAMSVLKSAITQAGWGIGPEFLAAEREAVKLLLQQGASFSQPLNRLDQQVFRAAALGNLDALRTAVAQGGSINACDGEGWTPLTAATGLDHGDCANWLIQSGAPANVITRQNSSALEFAVQWGRAELTRALIAHGADPHRQPWLLAGAVKSRSLPIFQMLLDAGLAPKNAYIYDCIAAGQVEMARILLDKGVDPESTPFLNSSQGNVYFAVQFRQPEILRMLLDRGANPEFPAQGFTALRHAELLKDTQSAELIRTAIERRRLRAQ